MENEMETSTEKKLSLPSSVFDELAAKYESGLGGAQNYIVRGLLSHAKEAYPMDSSSVIHDNACGPAVVTSQILSQGISPPPQIFATDYAQGMIDITTSYKERNSWDTVTIQLMDGQSLGFEDEKFTHSISSLGVFMFPDDKKGLLEMKRTLKHGGWIGVSSWKDILWPAVAATAYERVFPDAKEPMVLPLAKHWMSVESCENNLREAGFKDVKAEVVPCINRQPSKEVGASVVAGFLRQVSPTARAWDDKTWEEYSEVFKSLFGDMCPPASDGNGVEFTLYAIVTSGIK